MGGALTKPDGPVVAVLPAERPGESGIYRAISAKDKLQVFIDDDITTTYDAFTCVTINRFLRPPHLT